jgi:hypothetical protein
MSEEWRSVPGYEGKYEISNAGRIKSLSRVIIRSNGRKHTTSQKILKFENRAAHNGITVMLSDRQNSLSKCFRLARLVYAVFVADVPADMLVLHRNGDERDCNLTNLFLGDQKTAERFKFDRGSRFPSKRKLKILDIEWRTNGNGESVPRPSATR